ncbi:MAG: hypothetical protein MK207_09365 [Saprospiraceae bacterium]|nr:hypothetical protein [Saprospiraceae bacterium]
MQFNVYLLGLIALFTLNAGCENYKAKLEEEKINQRLVKNKMANLIEEEKLISGAYENAIGTLNEIDKTLSEIAFRNKEMDRLILNKNMTKDATQIQLIMTKLQSLKDANIESKNKAKRLRSQARKYKVENVELKKMIERLEIKFTDISKEVENVHTTIANMKIALDKLKEEISDTESNLTDAYAKLKIKTIKLEKSNAELQIILTDLKEKNNFIDKDAMGYIVCGTKKVLRKNKILRLLSNKTLTPEYQSRVKELGTAINFYDSDQINCSDGNIQQLLPQRISESYKIEGGLVTILDKKSFWVTSKTIVLVKQ